MAQALLQLLALCLDLIFRFVPSNGFANEEVRDENRNEEHEGGKDYNEGTRSRAMNSRFPRIFSEENFSTDIRSPRVFKENSCQMRTVLSDDVCTLVTLFPVRFFLEGMETFD